MVEKLFSPKLVVKTEHSLDEDAVCPGMLFNREEIPLFPFLKLPGYTADPNGDLLCRRRHYSLPVHATLEALSNILERRRIHLDRSFSCRLDGSDSLAVEALASLEVRLDEDDLDQPVLPAQKQLRSAAGAELWVVMSVGFAEVEQPCSAGRTADVDL